MGMEVRAGCASWTDADLIKEGQFYPKKTMTAEERLKWYGEFFSFVEVNSTYYALPSERNAALWSERTPRDFLFAVKAWAPMTGHHADARSLPREFTRFFRGDVPLNARGQIAWNLFPPAALEAAFEAFRAALQPLSRSGKIGYILFQLAPWMKYSPESLAYLAGLPRKLPGWPIAVEFRHRSWIPQNTGDALRFLTDHGLAHVGVDGPWMPRVAKATSSVFVLRCHGRNVEGWLSQLHGKSPTVAEKYDYLYSEKEVRELVKSVLEAEGFPRRKFIVFSNNRKNYPVTNALQAAR
ncbi:MAG: DUF72 domain-containing protein, partial [Elusimicrobia bacterium]|nr:DUF72 domain-containing protein [Elusimicrobiota bacterium]